MVEIIRFNTIHVGRTKVIDLEAVKGARAVRSSTSIDCSSYLPLYYLSVVCQHLSAPPVPRVHARMKGVESCICRSSFLVGNYPMQR